MSRWTIVVPHVFDELKYTGGLLSSILIKQLQNNIELSVEERPYIIICSVADEDSSEKGHIGVSQFYREIYETSQLLKFNYKILYKGREYHNKLNDYYSDLSIKLVKEIKFSKPEYLFIPKYYQKSPSQIDTNFNVIGLCMQDIYFNELYKFVPSLFSYNKNLDFGNSYLEIKRDFKKINSAVDILGDAYSFYKSRLTSSFSDTDFEYKYYSMSRCGAKINKEFAESYDVEHYQYSNNDMLSFLGLSTKETSANDLKIEDII